MVGDPDSAKITQRIKVEVDIGPNLKPGLISETVTAKFTDPNRPESKLYIYGIAVKDIEVSPLALTYIVQDNMSDKKYLTRVLKVISHMPDTDVKILNVSDPDGLLTYDVSEVEPGQKYTVTATLDETKFTSDGTVSSDVIITTNQPDQAEIKIPFRVERK